MEEIAIFNDLVVKKRREPLLPPTNRKRAQRTLDPNVTVNDKERLHRRTEELP
jgi:hypothetical protein